VICIGLSAAAERSGAVSKRRKKQTQAVVGTSLKQRDERLNLSGLRIKKSSFRCKAVYGLRGFSDNVYPADEIQYLNKSPKDFNNKLNTYQRERN